MVAFWGPVAAALAIGVLGWAVGIEPRIQVQETKITDLKELILVQLTGMNHRLDRIERALNGAWKHADHS